MSLPRLLGIVWTTLLVVGCATRSGPSTASPPAVEVKPPLALDESTSDPEADDPASAPSGPIPVYPEPEALPASDDEPTVFKVPIGTSPVLGPPDALVTLVQFEDYQCPFCQHVQPTLEQLRQKYGNEIRIVFKHNPLPFHDRAEPAATLAVEARRQQGERAFWQASELLFSAKDLEDASLRRIASQLKLDKVALGRALGQSLHAV